MKVIIWKKSAYGGGAIFGGGGKVNIESWRVVHTLRGHGGDVLDLAWAPNDALLATASVDNTVIVWNGERLPEVRQQAQRKPDASLKYCDGNHARILASFTT